MIVTDIKTGKQMEVNASYGARLIEQGKATIAATNVAKATETAPKTGKKAAVVPNGAEG